MSAANKSVPPGRDATARRTRVDAGIFHDFHHEWISTIRRALNNGLLPPEYYALAEQQAAGFGPDVLTLQAASPDADEDGKTSPPMTGGVDPIVFYLIVFVLAIFVGYHVVWSVTPALHTPLMSVTNAISAIILVGAMLAAGPAIFDWGGWVGVAAVVMASINAFGGFLVTQRMLEMFKKKEPKAATGNKPK